MSSPKRTHFLFLWDLGVVRNLPEKKASLLHFFSAPASLALNLGAVCLKVSVVIQHLPYIKQEGKIIPWGV